MVIVPSGKNYYDWSLGQDSKVTKVAGSGKSSTVTKTPRDAIYEAAEKHLASLAARKNVKKAQFDFGGEKNEEVKDGFGAGNVENVETEKGEFGKGEFGGKEVANETEGTECAEGLKDVVVEVANTLDEAVEKLDKAINGEGGEIEEVTVEMPFEGEDENKEVEIDLEDEGKDGIPGVDKEKLEDGEDEEGGIPKKSEDDKEKECCPCTKKEDKKEDKEGAKEEKMACAKSLDGFERLSSISPTTRKKVYNYWKDTLGYDPEFCKLMVTDFEKK